jgi:Tol biopolymer transport system component
MPRSLLSFAPVLLLLLSCAGAGDDESAAQAAPASAPATNGDSPELVQPGRISTERNETFPSIDPVDGSLWFSVYTDNFNAQTLMLARPAADGWDVPVVAPFSGHFGDRAPRFSPDGSHLYFTSSRPAQPGDTTRNLNVWVVTRGMDGVWSPPALVPAPVSEAASDMHAAVTGDGLLYFSTDRAGPHHFDIFSARLNGNGEASGLVPVIADDVAQTDLFVSPDGTRLIVVQTDAPGGYGGDDLYLCRFRLGAWSAPQNLGSPINSHEYEYGPSFSPDGRWLYFTSHRRGSADIYRIPVSALGPTE